jgi:hypothetical protein
MNCQKLYLLRVAGGDMARKVKVKNQHQTQLIVLLILMFYNCINEKNYLFLFGSFFTSFLLLSKLFQGRKG